jgi:class 3 adenylate cyclase/tetratricopeptide (TPR) repeat protein/DNA-binding IscR family transcriptional regulator
MRCPACGFENARGIKFCGECGASLKTWCSSCGFENAPAIKFCGECGKPLVEATKPAPRPDPRSYTPRHLAEKILTSRSALEGERKQVTVLFVDVKGSMDLAEQVDPEKWHRVLDRFFTILSDGVHRFEGTVNQYTGDGIMALFGAPIAHEDHARRACYAALQLRDELRRYADELRRTAALNFSVRMGLNSGEVVVGKIGDDLRMDYTAQGHTVGLAARMEQLAEAGRAYLTAETARLVSGFFRLRDLGSFELKGVSVPVQVYDLEGVGALHTPIEVSRARGFSRFVGREDETTTLEAALARAIGGNAQVVGIVGEPGVGKSRLCFEFLERCRARGLAIFEAHGVPHGKALPLLPMLELFRNFFGITDQDSDQVAREKIAGRFLLLDESLREVLPLVFDLLGVPDPERPAPPMDPASRQRQLHAVVKRVAQMWGRRQPGVTFLEDLHWFDGASEGFLEPIVEALPGTQWLVLVNFRPEYHAAWMQKSYYQQLPLLPLGLGAITELLRDLLGTDPSLAGLGDRISKRTGGNPFFIEEVVQVLAEAGTLAGARGAYRLAQPSAEIKLPATVQAVLAARIDRLKERDKHVLQTAAVIGKEFSEAVLKRVADLSEAELSAALGKLTTSEFIYEQALYPELQYSFKHALTQEVAYGSLLVERRQAIHERAAEAIEALSSTALPEHYAELAHHYSHSRNTEKAIEYSELTGQWAAQHSANAEAIRHLTTALELLKSFPDTLDRTRRELELQIALGAPLMATKGYGAPEVGAVYHRALELCRKIGETPELFRVLFGLQAFYLVRAELKKARELAEQLLNLAQRVGDPALLLQAHEQLGIASASLGEPTVAREHCDQGIALYDPERHRSHTFVYGQDPGVLCLAWAARTLWFLGYPDQALKRSDEALALAQKIAHPFSLAWALNFAASVHGLRREFPMASEYFEVAVALCAEQGFAEFLLWGTVGRGWALAEQGRTDEGIAQMRDALAAMPSRGQEFGRPGDLAGLAAAYGKAGRTDDALVLVAEALALVERRDERISEAEIYRVKGELLLESGASSEAETCFRHAIEVARRQSAKSLELRAVMSLSRLLRKQGKREEARQMLAEIYGWFTEGYDTADLKEAKALLEELS